MARQKGDPDGSSLVAPNAARLIPQFLYLRRKEQNDHGNDWRSELGKTCRTERLASPPPDLLAGASLFLDFDGTLVDLADRPEDVEVGRDLTDLLVMLANALGGRVALISGRSIAQLDDLLGPVARGLPLAGSHGFEHRSDAQVEPLARPYGLESVAERFLAFAGSNPGLTVEVKSYGVALHYRLAPAMASASRDLAQRLADETGLYLQEGKMVVELRPAGHDKGQALRRFMARAPMAGTRPVFVGDDVTDECAFVAAQQLGGAGILVGAARDTAALYRLEGPQAVRDWLRASLG